TSSTSNSRAWPDRWLSGSATTSSEQRRPKSTDPRASATPGVHGSCPAGSAPTVRSSVPGRWPGVVSGETWVCDDERAGTWSGLVEERDEGVDLPTTPVGHRGRCAVADRPPGLVAVRPLPAVARRGLP